MLAISGVLLAANDLIVIWRHQLMSFITTIPAFGSINGLLMGVVVPLAIVLWLGRVRLQKTNYHFKTMTIDWNAIANQVGDNYNTPTGRRALFSLVWQTDIESVR